MSFLATIIENHLPPSRTRYDRDVIGSSKKLSAPYTVKGDHFYKKLDEEGMLGEVVLPEPGFTFRLTHIPTGCGLFTLSMGRTQAS